MTKEWEPFAILWKEAAQWQRDQKSWMYGSFNDIVSKECEESTGTAMKTLHKAVKQLSQRGEWRVFVGEEEEWGAEGSCLGKQNGKQCSVSSPQQFSN